MPRGSRTSNAPVVRVIEGKKTAWFEYAKGERVVCTRGRGEGWSRDEAIHRARTYAKLAGAKVQVPRV